MPTQPLRGHPPRPLRQNQHRPQPDLRPQSFPAEIQQAISDGIKDSTADLAAVVKKVNTDTISSGDMFGTRDILKENYLYRYVGAKLGLYGNSKQDALYFGYFVDATHQPLDASKSSYELHFDKGALPPTKAFWSVTMYDGKTQLLVANPLNRYLLNSTTLEAYTYGSDGSLTLTSPTPTPALQTIQLASRPRRPLLRHPPRLHAGRRSHRRRLEEASHDSHRKMMRAPPSKDDVRAPKTVFHLSSNEPPCSGIELAQDPTLQEHW